jgi:hypothetical protein
MVMFTSALQTLSARSGLVMPSAGSTRRGVLGSRVKNSQAKDAEHNHHSKRTTVDLQHQVLKYRSVFCGCVSCEQGLRPSKEK